MIILRSSEGYGWVVSDSPSETYYSISDITRSTLYVEGTLSGPYIKDICLEKLEEGDYIFRVGGNNDDYRALNSWEFCGVTGIAQQELKFNWENGECTPGAVTNAADKIASSTELAQENDDGLEKMTAPAASEDSMVAEDVRDETAAQDSHSSFLSQSLVTMGMVATASMCGVLAVVVLVMSVYKVASKRSLGLQKVSQVDEDAPFSARGSSHGVASVNKGLSSEAPASSLVASKHQLIASLDL